MNAADRDLLAGIAAGKVAKPDDIVMLSERADLATLTRAAAQKRDEAHGDTVSYSRKVFIPLTKHCRDLCHYCTFSRAPKQGARIYMTADEVLAVAREGTAAGCTEALFTLGDKPELRYPAARAELDALGYPDTISYLREMADRVFRETGLFPHANAGLLTGDEFRALRAVSVSQGIMLESSAARLSERGGPHFRSPDKDPSVRLQSIDDAGRAAVPLTSGILIGIGETRRERIQSLLDLRASHERYGHIQEIIVQNFRAKPNTPMAGFPEPSTEELVWTIAMARLIFPADMNIQAPPNLSAEALDALVDAGLNDWGGVSPVTPDHVNPEAPWPHLAALERATNAAGKSLVQRLPVYPRYIAQAQRWLDNRFMPSVRQAVDAQGFVRGDRWFAGADSPMPPADIARLSAPALRRYPAIARAIARAQSGITLNEDEIVGLFGARDDAFSAVCRAADEMRKVSNGDTVTYVVNRNINYTNICFYKCAFCAFSKGKLSENLRGRPYLLEADEIERRVQEASDRGATEICMQGGIHPDFTGRTYLDLCKTVRRVAPAIHIHAFSPLEIWHGAQTLALSLPEFLSALIEAGLNSLPGTAAEILDDEVRKDLCPDKINTAQWFEVMEAAHRLGLSSTATIMFGHIDRPEHWARHLLRIRALQNRTGGFTEFVPLPFVHMESPVYLKGRARRGPTFREAVLMHAVARLVLYPHITNVQTSWVKMGPEGAALCLAAGANDLGGTLMNETITRSAGAVHGQEMSPAVLERLVLSAGREPAQRTNRYDVVRSEGHPVPVGQALPARSGLSRNWS